MCVHGLVETSQVHIEQGPVLEAQGLPLGVVEAIAGQTRLMVISTCCTSHFCTLSSIHWPENCRCRLILSINCYVTDVKMSMEGPCIYIFTVYCRSQYRVHRDMLVQFQWICGRIPCQQLPSPLWPLSNFAHTLRKLLVEVMAQALCQQLQILQAALFVQLEKFIHGLGLAMSFQERCILKHFILMLSWVLFLTFFLGV
jgi:hypothetical protein